MKQMTFPDSSSISRMSALNFSSNCPRIPEPAMIAERSIDSTRLFCRDWRRTCPSVSVSLSGDRDVDATLTSGTSLATMRLARPSRMAVFPTPGGPMSCKPS